MEVANRTLRCKDCGVFVYTPACGQVCPICNRTLPTEIEMSVIGDPPASNGAKR